MVSTLRRCATVMGALLVVMAQSSGAALYPEEAVESMAAHLDANQVKEGASAGMWIAEVPFMGPTTGGMARAYQWMGNPDYWACAELAGYYVLGFTDEQGNLLGDEVYAFLCLSEASEDPNDNVWRSALEAWYVSMRRPGYEESTAQYIEYFEDMEISTAVFYIAQHTIGAYYVDDVDKAVWRDALINYLSQVDDKAEFPVMALGTATWALAETGPLDNRYVTSNVARDDWKGVTLADLPGILASHQVPESEVFAGSFYWRFDHTAGGTEGVVAGYTEDTIFGTMGLLAAAMCQAEPDDVEAGSIGWESAIEAAQIALLEGIDENGCVYEHLSQGGQTYYTYAGEMLEVLWKMNEYQMAQEAAGGSDTELELELEGF